MKTRLLKEIRQLLPIWIAALLLATVPATLPPTHNSGFWLAMGFVLGLVTMAVASFGREFSQRTFAMLTVQPLSRERLWWEKVFVLLPLTSGLAALFVLFWKSSVPTEAQREIPMVFVALYAALAAIGGGLFLTLALRQVLAAICLTILVPLGLLMLVTFAASKWLPGWESGLNQTMLILYSTSTFLLARKLFLRAQDVQWTGGTVTLPGIPGSLSLRRSVTTSKSHPLVALVRKEFQLQQVSLLFAGFLLVVQAVALVLQKSIDVSRNSVLGMALDGLWLLWLLMPLMAGCSAVAEERKLGTLEPQLCLPVSRAWQFAVKVFVALVCGFLLGALVPVALAVVHPTLGATGMEFVVPWTLACICLALVSFYASSLTHHLLQALGAAIGITLLGLLLGNWFAGSFSAGRNCFSLFGAVLWRGPLFLFVGAGVMLLFAMVLTWRRLRWIWVAFLVMIVLALLRGKIQSLLASGPLTDSYKGFKVITLAGVAAAFCPVILTLALAAQNFKHTQTSLSLWWRNSGIWLGCLVLIGVLTALAYNRVWELVMPFEPPAGAPRLSGPVRPVIAGSYVDQPTFVLLPSIQAACALSTRLAHDQESAG
jgi:ABC-type transport system involved in multi-copper enzyme maturation permease subunit